MQYESLHFQNAHLNAFYPILIDCLLMFLNV